MSKQSRIKWRKSDEKELARLVKNFNAKVSRIEKKAKAEEKRVFEETGEKIGIVVPQKVTVQQLKKGYKYVDDLGNEIVIDPLIKTRKDFNRELKRLERFTERGSEEFVSVPNYDNLRMTSWQRKEMSNMQRQINRDRTITRQMLEQLPATSRGKKTGYNVLEAHERIGTGTISENSYKPVEAFPKPWTSRKEELGFLKTSLNKRFSSFRRQTRSTFYDDRAERLKENYIKAVKLGYGLSDETIRMVREGKVSPESNYQTRAAEVVIGLEDMSIDKFMKIFYAEGDSITFDWAYANETFEDESLVMAGYTKDSLAEGLKEIWLK